MSSTRFGVLSDIHGNVWALEAVLNDARRRGVSAFVNLGDILYGPLAPRETFERLKKTNLVAQVLGNQDRLIIDGTINPTFEWVRRDLGGDPVRWLSVIPASPGTMIGYYVTAPPPPIRRICLRMSVPGNRKSGRMLRSRVS